MELASSGMNWTHEQLLVAFRLYCEIPFGRMHSKNERIIDVARALRRTPSALAMKLTNIASLDPMIVNSGRRGLSAASSADRSMWVEMTSDWAKFSIESERAYNALISGSSDAPPSDSSTTEDIADFTGRSRIAVVNARIGQDLFRSAVLSAYNYACCVSGIAISKLLVASHIVPWRTDAANRLNPSNGLCLSVIHDRAFDAGLMAFSEDHRVVLSRVLLSSANSMTAACFQSIEGSALRMPQKFLPNQAFLRHHREQIFHA